MLSAIFVSNSEQLNVEVHITVDIYLDAFKITYRVLRNYEITYKIYQCNAIGC